MIVAFGFLFDVDDVDALEYGGVAEAARVGVISDLEYAAADVAAAVGREKPLDVVAVDGRPPVASPATGWRAREGSDVALAGASCVERGRPQRCPAGRGDASIEPDPRAWKHTRGIVNRPPADHSPEGVPPRGPLLILSPHYDDAALSCAALLDRDEPADLLNVFTGAPETPVRTAWVALTGFTDSTASMQARGLEDDAAFSDSPHRRRHLGLLDDELSPRPRPESDREEIVKAILGWAANVERGVVAAPAGAGRPRSRRLRQRATDLLVHPDHLVVRSAAIAAAERAGNLRVLLYEELPYALDVPADRTVRSFAADGRDLEPFALSVDASTKGRRIAAYASQLPHLGRHARPWIDDPASAPSVERYWYVGA